MKKRLYLITTIMLSAAALSLSSCLKDSRYVDLTKVGTIVNFPMGGAGTFGAQAVTATPDTDAKGTITLRFAVNVASPTVPTTATPITFDVDNPATVTAYDNANKAVFYDPMPANAYVFTQTSITILAGHRDTAMTVTFYKNLLDPSKSYMLPITIKSAGGLNISGNQGTMYFHFIGNDFAGLYTYEYTRYNNGTGTGTPLLDNVGTGTLSPVTPGEFQMTTGYNGQGVRYDVTFDRNVTGGNVTYSNFVVGFVPADVTGIWGAAGITVVNGPIFLNPPFDPAGPLTYAQAIQIFKFQYVDFNGSADRYIIDYYHK